MGKYYTDEERARAYSRKLPNKHIVCLEEEPSENCQLTLKEVCTLVFEKYQVRVSVEAVRANLEGRWFTIKKTHRDSDYRNAPANKVKRQELAMLLLQFAAAEKKILYFEETSLNIWISRNYGWSSAGQRAMGMNTSSKGKYIHVIACISRDGVEYHEGRFGSFDSEVANGTVLVMMRDQATRGHLSIAVVILDNAPCHTNVEGVFDELEFAGAECLRLGFYSPMQKGHPECFLCVQSGGKKVHGCQKEQHPERPR
ncbi:unnamed protein product [Phytophthora fragariaefolia]|uniref:Unnamed protein product n=1 Tax=Phytophthora fragariaefolia TaxID=1490495 RepID=A0A9W6X023_9STRA|nr:unnamed protein product [Phytophthora fragariaefolia]